MSNGPHNPEPSSPPREGSGGKEAHGLAGLYVAGALMPREVAGIEHRLAARDPEIVAAFEAVKPALDALLNPDPVAPPPHLRQAVMSRLGEAEDEALLWSEAHEHDEEPELAGAGAAGFGTGIAIARAATGRWRRTGVPGVRYRPLHADRRANRRTIMLHMAPGSALPDHDHAGDEEVIMISGDLSIAGTALGPGDYIRVSPGARHGVPRTTNGCICIVVSSYVPFPLSSWPHFVWTALKGLFARPGERKG